MKRILLVVLSIVVIFGLVSCSAADTASTNISTAADNFEIMRRITLYNGITDKVIQVAEGRCSLGNNDVEPWLSITCEIAPKKFIKNYWRISDNVTVYTEQLGLASVDDYHYRVIFRPESMIPNVEINTSGK